MWIPRDFKPEIVSRQALPIKVLKGPRQVGKTSLLSRMDQNFHFLFLDDALTRIRLEENPRFFLDQLPNKLVIDEAPLAPSLFSELKRRVDEARRIGEQQEIDIWLTGSNQTLIRRNISESLAGRASYFDINTLSIHELGSLWSLPKFLIRGGWPELYASPQLDATRYLNDFITTYIERDIVATAGIERHAAFLKVLHLTAGRVAELCNFSDIARNVGVDSTTVQSWLSILENNGIIYSVPSYFTNINKRLTKTPKYFFVDTALATRLQGWSLAEPILSSPVLGHLFENIVFGEIIRFFLNQGEIPKIYFVRSKENIEIDFLIDLGNQRFLAIEAKITPTHFTKAQESLLESIKLNVISRWVVCASNTLDFPNTKVVYVQDVYDQLSELILTISSTKC